ncbi:MAG: hypothetical protein K8T25_05545 [Planctomycetia bacterium]|nr:hypothetical protein [Planctomycetia bacterium]
MSANIMDDGGGLRAGAMGSLLPLCARPGSSPRGWHKFALNVCRQRLLLLLVALAAVGLCWVSAQVRVVHTRQAVVAWVQRHGGTVVAADNDSAVFTDLCCVPNTRQELLVRPNLPDKLLAGQSISWIRRFLGDSATAIIHVAPADVGLVEQLFPEALITTREPGFVLIDKPAPRVAVVPSTGVIR